MGFTPNGVEFLVWAKNRGVDYDRTMTLGRHAYVWISPEQMSQVLREHGSAITDSEAEADLRQEGGFAEPLLKRLGAEEIRSMDASAFEGATDVHDLNEPVPESLKGQFSAVVDGGTLEHVFNFPQAITNAMEMVELGGHLLLMTPTNNEGGHGFYQFAPDLFFRVLSPENGFSLQRMLLKEHVGRHWYEVIDPAELRRRTQFRSNGVAYLFVVARREKIVVPFDSWPQQSDYAAAWARSRDPELPSDTQPASQLKDAVRRFLPTAALNGYRKVRRLRSVRLEKKPALYSHQAEPFRRVDITER